MNWSQQKRRYWSGVIKRQMDSGPDFMEQLRSVFDIEMSIENKRLRKQLQKKKEWLKSETHMLGAVRQVLMNVLMSLSNFSSERLLFLE